jgi:tetratricopeptide (TPR) repeat protein
VSYSNRRQYAKAMEDIKKAMELDPAELLYKENLEICRRMIRKK